MQANFDKLIADWKRQKRDRKTRSEIIRRRIDEKGRDLFVRYGIEKVILFGSIEKDEGDATSDIDLYVEPLPPDRYWQFRRELEEAIEFPLDLYTAGDDPVFIRKILERGRVIYESQS